MLPYSCCNEVFLIFHVCYIRLLSILGLHCITVHFFHCNLKGYPHCSAFFTSLFGLCDHFFLHIIYRNPDIYWNNGINRILNSFQKVLMEMKSIRYLHGIWQNFQNSKRIGTCSVSCNCFNVLIILKPFLECRSITSVKDCNRSMGSLIYNNRSVCMSLFKCKIINTNDTSTF